MKRVVLVGVLIVLALLIGTGIGYALASPGSLTTILEPGSVQKGATVVVFQDSDGVVYYVKPDGDVVTDGDTTADEIQEALDYIGNLGGGKLVIREGTYTVMQALTPPNGTTIEGTGWNTIIKLGNGAESRLFYIASKEKITIRNIKLDGNKANQETTPDMVTIYKSRIILFENVKFIDAPRRSINIYNDLSYRIWITNCRFEDSAEAQIGIGITGGGPYDIWIIDCSFYGGEKAINIQQSAHDIHIKGCNVRGYSESGILAGSKDTYHIFIINNYVDGAGSTGDAIGVWGERSYVIGNRIRNAGDTGILFACVGGCCCNNIVSRSQNSGISLAGCQRSIISDNICFDNGQNPSTPASYAGIRVKYSSILERDATHLVISNNLCYDSQATKTQKYGIEIKDNATYITVIGNDVRGNSVSGIEISGLEASASNIIIKDNLGFDTEASGTATFSGDGSTTTFYISHGLPSTPDVVQVTPQSADASGAFYVTANSTHIIVTYTSAPPSGTDNVVLWWYGAKTTFP